MITDADVKKLEKVFATKEDFSGLDSKIERVDKKLDRTINYMNLKFNIVEEKLTKLDSIDSRLDSIMESLAWLTGEYKKLDNHEERIVHLEYTHKS